MYEARGIASSVAVDNAGNVYVGTSPLCRVYRISPDGTQQMILHGVGRTNHTVYAMKFIDNTLYVATGPTGGIYASAILPARTRKLPSSSPERICATDEDEKAPWGRIRLRECPGGEQRWAVARGHRVPRAIIEIRAAHARRLPVSRHAGLRGLALGTIGLARESDDGPEHQRGKPHGKYRAARCHLEQLAAGEQG